MSLHPENILSTKHFPRSCWVWASVTPLCVCVCVCVCACVCVRVCVCVCDGISGAHGTKLDFQDFCLRFSKDDYFGGEVVAVC